MVVISLAGWLWLVVFGVATGFIVASILTWREFQQTARWEVDSRNWPMVKGQVEFTRVGEILDFEAPYRFMVSVGIHYVVAGCRHTLTLYEPTNLPETVNSYRQTYLHARLIPVYYHPTDPHICTLEPGKLPEVNNHRVMAITLLASGLATVLGGVLVFS